jgi:RND family efflux transporter MFP subunit
MSSTSREEIAGRVAPRSLKDELASLKIDRKEERRELRESVYRPRGPRRGGGFLLRVLSLAIWLLPLGMVGGGAYFAYLQYRKIQAKPEVHTAVVQAMTAGEAEKLLSAKGYIKSRNQAMIGARTPGRVEKMLVEEGTKVVKGQLIAVLEHNDMDALLESRKASIAKVEAELEESHADLKEKERKARLQANLLSRNQAAADVAQEAAAARNMSAARLKAIEANLKLMKAGMKEVEETIRNMNIVAPFDGTVVEKGAEEGETITPGGMGAASGRGSVVTLANLDKLEVETDVTETLVSRVAIGQPAEVSVSAVPNRYYRGRLRQIIPMGDRARGTVKVKVEILDPDPRLFPELVATVHFLPDKAVNNPANAKPSLFVPKKAIFEENGHSLVWTVDAKGLLSRKTIEAVVTNDELARVEKGLVSGEVVVVDPPRTLRDGEQVKVAE